MQIGAARSVLPEISDRFCGQQRPLECSKRSDVGLGRAGSNLHANTRMCDRRPRIHKNLIALNHPIDLHRRTDEYVEAFAANDPVGKGGRNVPYPP